MDLAVEAVLQNQITNTTHVLSNGVNMVKTAPQTCARSSIFCSKQGLDFLVGCFNGVYVMVVGKPNTHWLERDHYLIF